MSVLFFAFFNIHFFRVYNSVDSYALGHSKQSSIQRVKRKATED